MDVSKWITVAARLAVAATLGFTGMTSAAAVPPPFQRPVGDFDGDGRSDMAVWQPQTGRWRFACICEIDPQTGCGFSHGHIVGTAPQAVAVPADYDGDGRADPAVYDPGSGEWSIVPLEGGSQKDVSLGGPGELPVPADYNGDGVADPAVWRPADGMWRWTNREPEWFGAPGDRPVPGDYDGDGVAEVAVWRPSDGIWYLRLSLGGYDFIQFGQSGDVPVPGDYDGDGRTDAAVFRPSNGQWWIRRSGDGSHYVVTWGGEGDLLVPADYDGDGTTDVAFYKHGQWHILGHPFVISFGYPDEVPATAIR